MLSKYYNFAPSGLIPITGAHGFQGGLFTRKRRKPCIASAFIVAARVTRPYKQAFLSESQHNRQNASGATICRLWSAPLISSYISGRKSESSSKKSPKTLPCQRAAFAGRGNTKLALLITRSWGSSLYANTQSIPAWLHSWYSAF